MATYGDMQGRIADELARTDLTTQIQTCILRAIRFYERRKWWFNERRTLTFPTVAAQEYYAAAANADIPNITRIDTIMLLKGTDRFMLDRQNWDYIEALSITSTLSGEPTDYAYYGQSIRLYPIPNAVWTLTVSGAWPLDVLTGNDSNAWTNEGEDLICCRAKWDVCMSYLKDGAAGAAAKQQEDEAFQALSATNMHRMNSGKIELQVF